MLISFRNCIQFFFFLSLLRSKHGLHRMQQQYIFALNFCILTGVKHVPSFAVAIVSDSHNVFVRENIISIYNVGPPAMLQPRTIYEHVTERRKKIGRKKRWQKLFAIRFCSFCCNNSCGITKMHFTMAWGEWNETTAQCECVFMSDGRCIYWHRQNKNFFLCIHVLFVCCFL